MGLGHLSANTQRQGHFKERVYTPVSRTLLILFILSFCCCLLYSPSHVQKIHSRAVYFHPLPLTRALQYAANNAQDAGLPSLSFPLNPSLLFHFFKMTIP